MHCTGSWLGLLMCLTCTLQFLLDFSFRLPPAALRAAFFALASPVQLSTPSCCQKWRDARYYPGNRAWQHDCRSPESRVPLNKVGTTTGAHHMHASGPVLISRPIFSLRPCTALLRKARCARMHSRGAHQPTSQPACRLPVQVLRTPEVETTTR